MKTLFNLAMFGMSFLIFAFLFVTHWRAMIFATGILIIFKIIVKNDLQKIQAERLQAFNEEQLKDFEEGMKKLQKVKK